MSPNAVSPRQTRVLVVEDNPADTLLTLEAFKAAGMTSGLTSVRNGKEAIAYVRRKGRYADAPVPDIIFLDLSQPRMSGLEVLRVIKQTPELMHIPIVVAAGSVNPRFVRAVYALNGNCFIRKPAELAQFLRFIESCHEFWSTVVTLSPLIARPTHRIAKPTHRAREKQGRKAVQKRMSSSKRALPR
jgi:two-component system, chemotaxis family, response regulator Rcp1